MNKRPHTSPAPQSADPLGGFLRRHSAALLGALVAGLTLLAWANRFIQDDAFISFRYARQLAEGNGLVWNAGEPIEGYTNFLWVILLALGMRLGFEPVVFSQALGLVLFSGTLLAAYRLIREVMNSETAALLGILFLGTNATFSAYATGGLETQLQTFLSTLIVLMACAALRRGEWTRAEILGLSLAMAAAMLTRLDSGLVSGLVALWCLASWRRSAPEKLAARLALFTAPLLVIVGAWLAWKLSFYGEILPNTFRLKGSFTSFERGAWYIHRFATSYLLYPALIVALTASARFWRGATRPLWLLAAASAAWIAYIVSVGGDFMEFRFMVPVLPLLAALAAWVLAGSHRAVLAAVLLLFAYGSLRHAATFRYDAFYEIESKQMLVDHLYEPKEQWVNIGAVLGRAFGADPEIRIAVTAAGSIPYYANLSTVDMLGLSDRFVADSGIVLGTRPGHRRIAPLSYLMRRRVHLALSHPTVVPIGAPTFVAPFLPRAGGEPLPDAPLIEIPLDARYKLIVWYLLPHPKIDAAIARNGWKSTRIVADEQTVPPGVR